MAALKRVGNSVVFLGVILAVLRVAQAQQTEDDVRHARRFYEEMLGTPLPQSGKPKPAAAPVTYQEVVRLLRTGQSEEEILQILRKSPIDVSFTLGEEQAAGLRRMRVSDGFIDALKNLKKQPTTHVEDVTDLVLILDCSGSMLDKTKEGPTKMEAAKRVVADLIQSFPAGRRLALVVYGHDKNRACGAVDVVRPLSELDDAARRQLMEYVGRLRPTGNTPIAGALKLATGEVSKAKGLSRVVLITDGMETCNGDPVRAAVELAEKANAQVDVIGFVLKPEESRAVNSITKAGRGKFYDAQTATELRKNVSAAAQVALKMPKEVTVGYRGEEPLPELSPVEKALVENLTDKDDTVREQAAIGLRQRKSKAAAPFLVKRVGDDIISRTAGMPDKEAAFAALREVAPERVVEALAPALQAPNEPLRVWAAEKLGEQGDRAAVSFLAKRVSDDRAVVYSGGSIPEKEAALAALKQLAPDKAEEALLEATKSKNPAIKAWSLKMLTAKETRAARRGLLKGPSTLIER